MALTEKRRRHLILLLRDVLEQRRLPPALAAKLFGKLGFATTQMFGRFGRAQMAAFKRRQHEVNKVGLNHQIERSIMWWLLILAGPPARPVPASLTSKKVVVSYSDGEGGSAGVGVALWHRSLECPVAAYLRVPREVRLLWSKARGHALPSERLNDIFSIEAVGPAVVLDQWPHLVAGEMWVHFIDNVGAQRCLVKGSSSVQAGDVIVSHTWEAVSKVQALLWVDRVGSKSNPVDALSRGCMEGSWRHVVQAVLPARLVSRLREELFLPRL